MITEEKKRLIELLTKLKKAHLVYINCNEEQKDRLFKQCDFLFDELVTFGKERTFYEALLVSGEEFLIKEYGDDAEKIFGKFKEEMTEAEVKQINEMTSEKNGFRATVAGKKGEQAILPIDKV